MRFTARKNRNLDDDFVDNGIRDRKDSILSLPSLPSLY